jgi:hypothetical protein
MSVKASAANWIVTPKFVFDIRNDGSISCLGSRQDAIHLLEGGKFEQILEPYRSMLLAEMRRSDGAPPQEPLEIYISFSGASCPSGTLLLNFSVIAHNTTEARLILHRDWLQTVQVRFAKSDADMLADKYEKIVVITPGESDLTSNSSYTLFSPGIVRHAEREIPVPGTSADLKDKSSAAFVVFLWPLSAKGQEEAQHARLAQFGSLITGSTVTAPTLLKIDPKLLATCHAK